MIDTTHTLSFDGAILARGFWLYVWEITTITGQKLYYVGRTGDSSSDNAQSPFNRMGQHLGFNQNSNVLRKHLTGKNVMPENCTFRLVAHGPIHNETSGFDSHRISRDSVAAMEKALAEAMTSAGYNVINKVHCRKSLDTCLFADALTAFQQHFPKLASLPVG